MPAELEEKPFLMVGLLRRGHKLINRKLEIVNRE
jgi:hypothetical protein